MFLHLLATIISFVLPNVSHSSLLWPQSYRRQNSSRVGILASQHLATFMGRPPHSIPPWLQTHRSLWHFLFHTALLVQAIWRSSIHLQCCQGFFCGDYYRRTSIPLLLAHLNHNESNPPLRCNNTIAPWTALATRSPSGRQHFYIGYKNKFASPITNPVRPQPPSVTSFVGTNRIMNT